MSDLQSYVQGKERDMLALLREMVNIDSGTLDKAGVDRLGALLSSRLDALGFSVERVPQTEYGDHLVARKPGAGRGRVLLVGHMDTVFSSGAAASRPFRMADGRAYGPGVGDMKGGLVCMLGALEALWATRSPAFDEMEFAIVLNSDEEVLSPTSRPIIEAEAQRADGVFVFEPARPGGEYVIARKGVGKYRLAVHGRASHAGSQPERGRSAILEMAHKIVAFHGLTDLAAGVTVNVGVVRGGERSNIVAEEAYAEIDLRVPSFPEADRMDRLIREIAATSVVPDTSSDLDGGLVFPPMEQTPGSRAMFETLREVGTELGLEVSGIGTGGGSDANYASQHAPTLDGMGPQAGEGHSDREYVEVPTIVERTIVAALLLERIGRKG